MSTHQHAVPRPVEPAGSLDEVRHSIDAVDERIVALLAERRRYAIRAAELKAGRGRGVKDAAREEQVISKVKALARRDGIEPDLVETLYRDMIAGFVRAELGEGAAPPPTAHRNISDVDALPPPEALKQRIPVSRRAALTVQAARRTLEGILESRDRRLFVVVGPCSIHDPAAALEYARRLRALAEEVSDTFVLVMRTYFEKPRTSVGWEGFTSDPRLDGSCRLAEGLERSRQFLLEVNELGLPAGTEALDPIGAPYRDDLMTWTAIGARTSESQTHRNLASGLSTPIGFKNGTDGRIEGAVNAVVAARRPHAFIGINDQGRSAVVRTRGNRYGHLVLRGGAAGPNYDAASVRAAERALAAAGLARNVVIDCSHANSGKDPALQPAVVREVVEQVRGGNRSIVGLMLESFLEAGSQPIPADPSSLRAGRSVTDGCLDWETTAGVLREARLRLREVVAAR